MKLFETDIRKDQEKKTIDECFTIVNNETPSVIFMGGHGLDRIDLLKKINDIKTIEDDNKKEKTQPCPACGKPLITPKEYFPALTKMNEAVHAYREVLIKDYEVEKKIEAGICPQCDNGVGKDELIKNGSVCAACREQNNIDNQRISELVIKGHTDHCAKRIVWGDGECECGKGYDPS